MFKGDLRQKTKKRPALFSSSDPRSITASKAFILSMSLTVFIGISEIILWHLSENELFYIEGFGNLVWVIPDAVLLAMILLGGHKADFRMHFGYQRIETLTMFVFTLAVALYVLYFFFETLFFPSPELNADYGPITVIFSLIVIGLLCLLYRYIRAVGKRLNSQILLLDSVVIKADIACMAIILVSGLIQVVAPSLLMIHTILTLLVAIGLFIYSVGECLGAAKELIDANPSMHVMNLTEKITEELPEVLFISDHRIRSFGGAISVDITIETDPEITVREAYEISEKIEERISSAVDNVLDVRVRVTPAGTYLAKEASDL
ncbi:cation diffusion facilitator family transporter [Methanolacinia petrolearia]|uniref:cation diffusion facilitator family transporter n=1 Tax=Methanolacinia petrolearia TaxID=54120 RepID=UPI003BA8C54C